MFTNFPESRQDRLDSLVVDVESIGIVSKPTQQLRSKVFRLQVDVWGFSQRHGEGGVSDVKHTAPPRHDSGTQQLIPWRGSSQAGNEIPLRQSGTTSSHTLSVGIREV